MFKNDHTYLENYMYLKEMEDAKIKKEKQITERKMKETQDLYDALNKYRKQAELKQSEIADFSEATINTHLQTVFEAIYISALQKVGPLTEADINMAQSLVKNYIKEHGGANAIMNRNSGKTYLLDFMFECAKSAHDIDMALFLEADEEEKAIKDAKKKVKKDQEKDNMDADENESGEDIKVGDSDGDGDDDAKDVDKDPDDEKDSDKKEKKKNLVDDLEDDDDSDDEEKDSDDDSDEDKEEKSKDDDEKESDKDESEDKDKKSDDDNKESDEDSDDKDNSDDDKEDSDNESDDSDKEEFMTDDLEDDDSEDSKESDNDTDDGFSAKDDSDSDDEDDTDEGFSAAGDGEIETDPGVEEEETSTDEDNELKGSKEDMFKKLENDETVDNAVDIIAKRIADAEAEFIKRNAEDKQKIEKIADKIDERIQSVTQSDKSDEEKDKEKEELKTEATRTINEVKHNRFRIVFEEMVENNANYIVKDKALLEAYTGYNNKLDFTKVVEATRVQYGFLEFLNTVQLEKVDKDYILNVVNERI